MNSVLNNKNDSKDIFKSARRIFGFLKSFRLAHLLSDEIYLKFKYKRKFGKALNLVNPQGFNEKMQWLKINNRRPSYTKLVDKYAVKSYIKDVIGEKYLIPLIGGPWEHFDEINFDSLPDKFVLKCSHDSGGIVICRDKKSLNKMAAKEKIEESLCRDFYLYRREWVYKNIPHRIFAEEYVENTSDEGLHDYKVWCFMGKPVYIQYINGRLKDVSYEVFFDTDWVAQNFCYHNEILKDKIPKKPERLEELLSIAEILAQGHLFIRADFYILADNSIKFGELTFYPNAGLENWHPEEMDKILGDKICIEKDI